MQAGRDQRTYRIIGAAMEVHRVLGPCLDEATYQEALALEMQARAIPFRREAPIEVCYKGQRLGRVRRMDFLCFDGVAVELKAADGFHAAHVAQVLHYMRAASVQTGLLLGFGGDSLQFRRLIVG